MPYDGARYHKPESTTKVYVALATDNMTKKRKFKLPKVTLPKWAYVIIGLTIIIILKKVTL